MRYPFAVLAAASVLALLAACAPVAGPANPALTPVEAQGTVIQVGDAPPQICLGPVAESYPPQCSGPVVTGWDWSTVSGQETAGDVTWGVYAVWGDWDGTALAVTGAILLALYDPAPDGATDLANLNEIWAETH